MTSTAVHAAQSGIGNTGLGYCNGPDGLPKIDDMKANFEPRSFSNGSMNVDRSFAAADAMAKVVAPLRSVARSHRSRGCQHCITCSGLQQHCHSSTVR